MQIVHVFDKIRSNTDKEKIFGDSENAGFLLTNKNLGYVYFSGKKVDSRYQGVFFPVGEKLFRVIADLRIDGNVNGIVNRFYSVERAYEKNVDRFLMPWNYNSLIYELEKNDWISLRLDTRETYSQEKFGRYYEFSEENGRLVVKYTKKNEFDGKIEYENYLIIHGAGEYKKVEEWENVPYEGDKERNSPPFEMFIYNALKIKARTLIFSFSDNKEKAMKESEKLVKNLVQIEMRHEEEVMRKVNVRKKLPKEIKFAYSCCLNSLEQLKTGKGLIAGFPWFFQHWTRDELIAMNALEAEERKGILMAYLSGITPDGRLPNILNSEKTNADSIGWLFKRISDSLKLFNSKEKKVVSKILSDTINKLEKGYVISGLSYNEKNETWMDSSFAEDNGREGFRIEIQAMFLNMLSLTYELTKEREYREKEKKLKAIVIEKFWNGKILADGIGDFTIRPNIFLAYYLYPDLLSRKNWEKCFENSLKSLWLDWGGLSSIDKNSKLFSPRDTGEDPRSYHRGNSWFFLNNLAAVALSRINKKRFQKQIERLMHASTDDILWNGAIGHHSELSSAEKQTAGGCVAQAWSAASYTELIDEIG